MSRYTSPVDRMLTHGASDFLDPQDWPDYVTIDGLTAEHIPDLIRMVGGADLWEDRDDVDGWATIHARRALGQLRAVEAVTPLLAAMDEFIDFDDYWLEELPYVLVMMGTAAIPPLAARLDDRRPNEYTRSVCIRALREIAREHPESREDVVALLTSQLAKMEDDEAGWFVNASIADALAEMKAVESAAVIEAAFAADVVEEVYAGGWATAKFRLGLGPEPKHGDVRPQWRLSFGPPPPPKRPDPMKLLKKKKAKKRR